MIDKKSDEGIAWYVAWTECFEDICSAFPNAKPESNTSDVYADRLCDLEPKLLRAAVEQVICTHRYGASLPTIADIRDAARILTEPMKHSALEVWGATYKELQVSYADSRPVKLDPEIKALVDALGGRRAILDSTKPGIERSQFIKAWDRSQAEKERVRSATPFARVLTPEPQPLALPEGRPMTREEKEERRAREEMEFEARRAAREVERQREFSRYGLVTDSLLAKDE